MVTINIYGLDQFVVGELSGRITKDLAKIYEIAGIDDEDIDLSERSEEKASPNIID